jgi:hypothetical protein
MELVVTYLRSYQGIYLKTLRKPLKKIQLDDLVSDWDINMVRL